jgi:16S rRNA (guanine(966)-N(2))-methyltransferase RsmD
MRIISGQWGGQPLSGKSSPKLRPTSDKVKEAIFDQLEAKWVDDWKSLRVLDLFAGTGALGFEALSRGASQAVFVEHHLAAVKNLKASCNKFEVQSQTQVICKGAIEAIRWLSKKGAQFDLIFLDPPYREDWIVATLGALQESSLVHKKSLIVAEHDKRENIQTIEALWKTENARRYGDSMITLLSSKA